MAKDKNLALDRKEKKKWAMKASYFSFAPPPGWVQGDWLPSRVTKKEVRDLAADGFVLEAGWRLPDASKVEPAPNPDERVLLTAHIDRGFSMSPHPFFRAFLNYFGAQLHHLAPNVP